MTLEIALTLIVIALTLTAFVREWAGPDVIAITVLVLVVALGLISPDEMLSVFSNEAPLTIGALFIIGGALERSGAVDRIGKMLRDRLSGNARVAIFAFSLVSAFFSAWMNNTAIVAILLPVTLGFARSKDIPASKLLMPLSYASMIGGCCTLIGTSTNLLVNGALKDLGGPGTEPLSMFELAPVGLPMAVAVIGYMAIIGPKVIPTRSTITGSLEIDHRTTQLYHLLVGADSPIVGKKLIDTELGNRDAGIHVMEIRRQGTRLMLPVTDVVIEPNDRFMVALHRRRGGAAKSSELFESIGAELLSQVQGIVSELVIREESDLVGRSLAKTDFRQRYNSVVLAVHRSGLNITSQIAELPLETGDTLLVITARNNLEILEKTRDFVLTDTPDESPMEATREHKPLHAKFAWTALIAVVLTASVTDFLHRMYPGIPKVPIHYAAMIGALALLWLRVMKPREAYSSIDWTVLLMLYGLLGLGITMQSTGTAEWLSKGLVGFIQSFLPEHLIPIVMLWLIFLLTMILTEMLSNNATAVMMIPIAVTMGVELEVDPRPLIIAVTLAASCAFSMPMGYQTHMMVYGPGGYRFTDFLRVGLPLNLICWVIACSMIPLFWSF
ncbi:MAG: SLC13 family permease [Akkermansiaceae bacterium]|nr:SLC13 family permease [Akkermansiaceae bacterium]